MENSNQRIRSFLDSRHTVMFDLLEKLVTTQSGSHNVQGVNRMGRRVAEVFADSAFNVSTVSGKGTGDHLVVRSRACDGKRPQVLMVGHMDTVFPADTAFTGYSDDGEHCHGPGVIDMKGGLVAGIYALKALEHCGDLESLPLAFIFNSDEEIGSPSSRELIREEAARSIFAFVLECGGASGEVVTGRKGNLTLRIAVKGRAGHAAFAGPDKASAILEMARKVIAIEALNQPERGISANVGTIRGGIGANTVPDRATARVDFRFVHPDDQAKLAERAGAIVATAGTAGTIASLEVLTERPPMPSAGNESLYRAVARAAASAGPVPAAEHRKGVSDANIIASEKVPVIDGFGPLGARDHSEEEYMVRKSLPERALLVATALKGCWQDHLAGRL